MSSDIAVWNSNITCRPPCEISGWYGVYGVRNSERLGDRVDDRGDVVVVHPGAQEALVSASACAFRAASAESRS